jgi:hypothetical protein
VDTLTLKEDVLTTTTPPISGADSLDISDDGKFVAIGVQHLVGSISSDHVEGWTPPCPGDT